MNNAKDREKVRSAANAARSLAKDCSPYVSTGICQALIDLANAVELLADVSERQEQGRE
jgi:hypothetical protein